MINKSHLQTCNILSLSRVYFYLNYFAMIRLLMMLKFNLYITFNRTPVKAEDLNICQSISEKCTVSEASNVTNKIWQNPVDPVSHIDERKMENGNFGFFILYF